VPMSLPVVHGRHAIGRGPRARCVHVRRARRCRPRRVPRGRGAVRCPPPRHPRLGQVLNPRRSARHESAASPLHPPPVVAARGNPARRVPRWPPSCWPSPARAGPRHTQRPR
jgi:hypothetical protein